MHLGHLGHACGVSVPLLELRCTRPKSWIEHERPPLDTLYRALFSDLVYTGERFVYASANPGNMRTAERHSTEEFGASNGKEEDVTITTFLEGFASDLRGYVNAQRDHLLMTASLKFAKLMGQAVHNAALIGGFAIALLFLHVALALYLGELLASYPVGFLLTALLALIMVGIFHLWWTNGGRERFLLARINDMTNDDDEI